MATIAVIVPVAVSKLPVRQVMLSEVDDFFQ